MKPTDESLLIDQASGAMNVSMSSGNGLLNTVALGCQAAMEFATTPRNFQNPFVVRKWLKQLRPDPISALRIKPNLRLPKKTLGFSFASNSLGLRGPEARDADNVLFGTSYAMGFGVDNGANWYELCLDPGRWLNLALPVGPAQQRALSHAYYHGRPRRALVLYFANFFPYAKRYHDFSGQADDVFEYFRWRHRYKDCARVMGKLPFKVAQALHKGNMLFLKSSRGVHLLDLNYGVLHRQSTGQLFENTVAAWRTLLQPFESVHVLRVPCKNEAAAESFPIHGLNAQRSTLDDNWEYFRSGLQRLPAITFQDLSRCFELEDYLLWDNHYNERGNRKLAHHVSLALQGRDVRAA
ncbi:hypothetical protein [Desulfolutivibrio sp.]|uniref:hypothetical protein n=1 Tax=Desulfolutivibrio sp. TaxID=2773296 RepID=UPI002F962A15